MNATAQDTLHFDWFGWTAADWSALSSMATIVGVVVGLFGGFVALRTYRSANRVASDVHMHSLFREYLRTQFDFELGLMSLGKGRDTEEFRERLGCEAAPMKLYALEEMWSWLDEQRRRDGLWIGRMLLSRFRRRQESHNAWAATILSHVATDIPTVLDNLTGATDCYSLDFLRFLAEGLEKEDREFRLIYEDQLRQAAAGGPRSPYYLRHPNP